MLDASGLGVLMAGEVFFVGKKELLLLPLCSWLLYEMVDEKEVGDCRRIEILTLKPRMMLMTQTLGAEAAKTRIRMRSLFKRNALDIVPVLLSLRATLPLCHWICNSLVSFLMKRVYISRSRPCPRCCEGTHHTTRLRTVPCFLLAVSYFIMPVGILW